jgi:REP element-mobilizing transposase RayT
MLYPMALHITWGAYGARLHGSHKPHVDRDHNQYGAPFAPEDPARENAARDRMKQSPVLLTVDQRREVERAIAEVAERYDWTIHSMAAQSDHIHVVITACREGKQLRDALKAVASRALNKRFGKKTWWAEGGSAKYLWERSYFENARDYVSGQRDW